MLTKRQQHCLQGIGIHQWHSRQSSSTEEDWQSVPSPLSQNVVETTPVTQKPIEVKPTSQPNGVQAYELNDWEQTLAAIEACQNCVLAQTCNRKVPGKGYQQADLMLIGEAPGRDEDLQGLPFVGRAGQLLDKMLQAIHLDLNQVYITNILKCRPPNNRDPLPDEVLACGQFLRAQIKLVQPKVILSVGRISAQNLLNQQKPLGQLRDKLHHLPDTDIPLLVTYHPAYLLRNPAQKAKVWEDLKTLHRLLQNGTI